MKLLLALVLLLLCSGVRASPEQYLGYAKALELKHSLSPGILRGICEIESNWNPRAVGRKGEVGLCQVLPNTARRYLLSMDRPYLAAGSVGAYVKELQGKLGLPQTGKYTESTRIAVVQHQRANGLRVDGVVGPQTWGSLVGADNTESLLFNPKVNLEVAAMYLADIMHGTPVKDSVFLACKYNAGEYTKWCALDYMHKAQVAIQKYREAE